jgi:hypothetical protein
LSEIGCAERPPGVALNPPLAPTRADASSAGLLAVSLGYPGTRIGDMAGITYGPPRPTVSCEPT